MNTGGGQVEDTKRESARTHRDESTRPASANVRKLASRCLRFAKDFLGARKGTAFVLLCSAGLCGCSPGRDSQLNQEQILTQARQATCIAVDALYTLHRQAPWTVLSGRVIRLLPDAHGRYEHQRFIVRCPSGHTVLIVNDVSIGQRASVNFGDRVAVKGKFVWSAKGGLLHFTHHDDLGGPGGWIAVADRVYS